MKQTSIKVKYFICPVCGSKVAYKTKKPKTCPACKNTKQITVLHGASKLETLVLYAVTALIGPAEYIINGYYSWLVSPKGAPMQLDFYCPRYKFVIEVQGAQHNSYNRYLHKTRKGYEYSKRRDKEKYKACVRKGLTVIYITPSYKGGQVQLLDIIKQYDPKLEIELHKNLKSKR